MNPENEMIRALTHTISEYERMQMAATLSNDRQKADIYKRKAERCRDELNYILRSVDLDAR